MNTYEIRKADGTTISFDASGYSRDMRSGVIAFYDTAANAIASYPRETWVALNVTTQAIKADPVTHSPAIKANEFALYYGH